MGYRLVSTLLLALVAVGSIHCGSGNGATGPRENFFGAGGMGTGGSMLPSTGGAPGAGGAAAGGTGGGTGGATAAGGAGGGGAEGPAPNGPPNSLPEFINLAPPMLAPLDPTGGTPLDPPPPLGWVWYEIEGALCRDASPTGFYVRYADSKNLMIYMEGGGACSSPGFCNYNPANVNQVISGDGQTVLGSALGVAPLRQQPGVFDLGVPSGIFDVDNPQNPVKDWNIVYVPYCTGDVHGGTRSNVTVPGLATPQQFVGHLNMRTFIGHLVPTFADSIDYVLLNGTSAGSFGAALNASMIQDAFGDVRMDVLMDSGPPFEDEFMPTCMQKRWREQWGLDATLPPDCVDCFNADGGGILNLADFLLAKHPNSRVALISSMHDEVIRLFFSSGLSNCSTYETADPIFITVGQITPNVYMEAAPYEAGLNTLRNRFGGTGRFSTYFIGGANIAFHQHVWRPRFYDASVNPKPLSQFVGDFINGVAEHVGP